MKIVRVSKRRLRPAAIVFSLSWRASHRDICTQKFMDMHTPRHQQAVLRKCLKEGKRLYMLIDRVPVGLVTLQGSLIETLYIHPAYQSMGYGSRLLAFAMSQCQDTPTLWVLDCNPLARAMYEHRGFCLTGKSARLSDTLCELEMRYQPSAAAVRKA